MDLTLRERLALRLYQAVLHVALPVGVAVGLPFMLAKAKRRRTVFRRLGFQSFADFNFPRQPLWIHALSLGETLSCVTLVKELRRSLADRPLVFSTSTLAGRQIAEQRLAGCVDRFFYFPFDLIPATRRVFAAVRPAMAVFIETDVWPGILHTVRRRGLAAFLVNGRLSPGTFRSSRRFNVLFRPALDSFEAIFPQSEGEANRYRAVGVSPDRIGAAGNLKFDAAAAPPDPEARKRLVEECGLPADHPIWVAGSTHRGEEDVICSALRHLRRAHPQLRLILVPRHPQRALEVKAVAARYSFESRLLTETPSTRPADIVVVDVMGRLASLYHLATVAFVGGSIVPKGGQNPIEPAAAGKPVLFGPDMSDFPDVARELVEREAAVQVSSPDQLAVQLERLLADRGLRERMGANGQRFVAEHSGATRRVVDLILRRLEKLS